MTARPRHRLCPNEEYSHGRAYRPSGAVLQTLRGSILADPASPWRALRYGITRLRRRKGAARWQLLPPCSFSLWTEAVTPPPAPFPGRHRLPLPPGETEQARPGSAAPPCRSAGPRAAPLPTLWEEERRALRLEVCASPRTVPAGAPGSTLAAQAQRPRLPVPRGGGPEGGAAAAPRAGARGDRFHRPLGAPRRLTGRPGNCAVIPFSLPPPCSRS